MGWYLRFGRMFAWFCFVISCLFFCTPRCASQPPVPGGGTTPGPVTQQADWETNSADITLVEWSSADSGTYFSLDVSWLSPKHFSHVDVSLGEEFEPPGFTASLQPLTARSRSLAVAIGFPRLVLPAIEPGDHVVVKLEAFRFSAISQPPAIEIKKEMIVRGASNTVVPAEHDQFGGSLVRRYHLNVSTVPTIPGRAELFLLHLDAGTEEWATSAPVRLYSIELPVTPESSEQAWFLGSPSVTAVGGQLDADLGSLIHEGAANGHLDPGAHALLIVATRKDYIQTDEFGGDEDTILYRILR